MSVRAIARSLRVSPSTVGDYVRRAEVAGVGWPVPESVDDVALERRLFPTPLPSGTSRPLPAWSDVHRELRRKSVTLALLWQEYKATHPEGVQYSRFCEQYRAWAAKLDVVMRQEHRAGERMFVDYAGQTVPVVDPETGELRQAQVFVAVLGASSYTFAGGDLDADPDWTASHVRAFAFFGGFRSWSSPTICAPRSTAPIVRAHRRRQELDRPGSTWYGGVQHGGSEERLIERRPARSGKSVGGRCRTLCAPYPAVAWSRGYRKLLMVLVGRAGIEPATP